MLLLFLDLLSEATEARLFHNCLTVLAFVLNKSLKYDFELHSLLAYSISYKFYISLHLYFFAFASIFDKVCFMSTARPYSLSRT